jgi:uncharacterized membrane protein YccC
MTATAAVDDQATTEKAPSTFDSAHLKYAIKTALALTLAYLIPMAMGWPQPQTAATTVMLIAATGAVSDSLQKGVLRILGTLAGAVIGLSLIALFPQDRALYLLAVSVCVSVTIYLYSAYVGDGTVFMLTAVVTLMVFNEGDADGAFLYGVDRAFMTALGVTVYTLTASLLWPVRSSDNIREMAQKLSARYSRCFALITGKQQGDQASIAKARIDLIATHEEFFAQYNSSGSNSEAVKAFLSEWQVITACLDQLENMCLPALRDDKREQFEIHRFILDYDSLADHIGTMFDQLELAWMGEATNVQPGAMKVSYQTDNLQSASLMETARAISRGELLREIQTTLVTLHGAIAGLWLAGERQARPAALPAAPKFDLLNAENVKTGIRAFLTFWLATALWIEFNPPGGFTFVTLATVLVALVSYSPVTPKLLIILFSLGFFFALPSYVFLLPLLSHWLELGLFLFAYSFIGFYVFKGPVAIFFLLGLIVLGIQNEMHYNFAVILSIVLMFYMICALLIVSISFPFTSKPEKLYPVFCQRFFDHCAWLLAAARDNHQPSPWRVRYHLRALDTLTSKMQTWGAGIDSRYFNGNPAEDIAAFNESCSVLRGQIDTFYARQQLATENKLVARFRRRSAKGLLAGLCDGLSRGEPAIIRERFKHAQAELPETTQQLQRILRGDDIHQYSRKDAAQFFVLLNLQASVYNSILDCRDKFEALNWPQLRETRI